MLIRNLILGSAALLVMTNVVLADEKPLETKRETPTKAAQIDFGKELGLTYSSLSALGGKIDSARESEDPVALAVASVELAADEKASGKTADVKAADLAAEAIELAKQRFHAPELKSVAALLAGNTDAEKLNEVAGKAEKLEAAAKASKDSDAQVKAKGIMGTLHVDNHTPEILSVYIDGNFVGFVNPFGDGFLYIGQSAWETTYISVHGSAGSAWTATVGSPVGDYTSVIRE